MSRTVSYTLEVNWSGSLWVNESDYLLTANGNEEIGNPDESLFSAGGYTSEMNLTLFNKDRRFSPSNSSGLLYASIGSGKYYQKAVRLTVVLGGISFVVFKGFIKGITESARTSNEGGTVILKCTSEDTTLIKDRKSVV